MDEVGSQQSFVGPVRSTTILRGSNSPPDLSDKWFVESGTWTYIYGPLAAAIGAQVIAPQVIASLPPTAAALEQMAERYQTNPGSGTTVLGRFANGRDVLVGFREVAARLGENAMNVPNAVWDKLSKSDQWNLNRAVLDQVTKRGDKIRLSSDFGDQMTRYTRELANGADWLDLGGFTRELAYLRAMGYRMVESLVNGQTVQFMEKIP